MFERLSRLCWGLLLLGTLSQCTPGAKSADKAISTDYDPQRDYFSTKIDLQYAQQFEVSYHRNYKIVRTHGLLREWGGTDSTTLSDIFILVQRGTPAPELKGELANAQVINIPVERVATNYEASEAYLTALQKTDQLVAVGGVISYDDTIRQRALRGTYGQVGYSWHSPPNTEVLLARNTDLFLMVLSDLGFQKELKRCRDLGIPTATSFPWAESQYLGRAEWLKFYALFFNAEAEANALFAQIEGNVKAIQNKTQGLKKRPAAIWGYCAGGDRWRIHQNSLECQLMRDAGLNNIFEDLSLPVDNTGASLSSEELLVEGKDVDHWIIGDAHSAALPNEVFMSSFVAWKKRNLYHNLKRSRPETNSYDWYSSAFVYPDRILADLVKLAHPTLLPDHELYYLDRYDPQKLSFPLPDVDL